MSGYVVSVISVSGMVKNEGVDAGIASPALSVQHVFPLYSFKFRLRGRRMSFRCMPTSGRVGSAISKSGIVENVGVAVGIDSPYVSVQKLFPLPVSTSGFLKDI